GAISAHLAVPFYGAISASKSALASLNDVMRLEFSRYGISVRLIEPGAMATGIFATARAACDDRLAALPEVEATWRPAMRAMETAFAKSGADDPDIVARAVMKALKGKGPARRVIGRGAGTFKMLGGLPIALRDPLIKDALGLKSYLLPR
ncbi:MAG: SDR family NAD(P)-dependent oxidoreductase, partial [Asticcacaulis sp.]|nr:SDR family NAD(P)-dependent oxidoreductase [Asticcacaulis sp.]